MDKRGDLFCLPSAQDYSAPYTHTVEQLRVCLLHCCGITLLACPHRRPIVKTPGSCHYIALVTSLLTWAVI